MGNPADNSALSSLKRIETYRALNGGAHRKPPPIVGSPSLARHIGFWIPRKPSPARGKTAPDASTRGHRDQWLAQIDWFLAELSYNLFFSKVKDCDRASSFNISFRDPKNVQLMLFRHKVVGFADNAPLHFQEISSHDIDRYETVSFHFFFHGVPAKIRAELHTEYFTLSCFLEFDELPNPEQRDDRFVAAFGHFAEHFRKKTDRALSNSAEPFSRLGSQGKFVKEISDLGPTANVLYETIWKEFQERVIEPALHPKHDGPALHGGHADEHAAQNPSMAAGQALGGRLGSVFADFRGLTMTVGDPVPPAGETGASPSARPAKGLELIMPHTAHARKSLSSYVGERRFSPQEEHAIVEATMPLLGAAEHAAREIVAIAESGDARRSGATQDYIPRIEYTASSVLDHRAVYLSCLGPQRPWRDTHEPVRYVIVANHRYRWQLGRLLDRFHTTGILRLASLIDLNALQQCAFDIRDLNGELLRIEDESAKTNLNLDPSSEVQRAKQKDHVRRLNIIQDKIGELSHQCEGGVEHRTSRSRLYVENFRNMVRTQRIDRIEGFQDYSQFVERRLGATWSYIHSLPRRFEQLRSHLSNVYASIQTSELIAQTAQQVAQTSEQVRQSKHQVELLRFAEWVSIVPVTYYAGHILKPFLVSFIEGIHDHLKLIGITSPAEHDLEIASYVLAAIIYLFVVFSSRTWRVLKRIFGKYRQRSEASAKAS